MGWVQENGTELCLDTCLASAWDPSCNGAVQSWIQATAQPPKKRGWWGWGYEAVSRGSVCLGFVSMVCVQWALLRKFRGKDCLFQFWFPIPMRSLPSVCNSLCTTLPLLSSATVHSPVLHSPARLWSNVHRTLIKVIRSLKIIIGRSLAAGMFWRFQEMLLASKKCFKKFALRIFNKLIFSFFQHHLSSCTCSSRFCSSGLSFWSFSGTI